ncbi:mycothiol system anti-sigma-R factor [Corynebacterium sp.]|uniref:mycothiol system anti-sigma-R factor n=1 Tax=Corynebacterium sp. TaxID=1720 RepID=UPI0026DF0621|nr:mycothiol system anti-sigma-R factor [Corynebacterium sp.]MDO5513091.1 mycothiol system anti-sigma-R factor [Corynebacterium sp.]
MTDPCKGPCEEMQAQMCALFDPSTTPEEAREILRAIAQCPDCHGRFESEQEIRALLRRCCTAEASAPATLRQRITMEIRQIRVTRYER